MSSEASVNLSFRKKLAVELPGAVIMKHHDSGFIGMPDCSVTHKSGSAWLEFKLLVPTARSLRDTHYNYLGDAVALAKKSEAQWALMCRLATQGRAFYLVWVRGMDLVVVFNPLDPTLYVASSVPYLPLLMADLISGQSSL